MANPRKLSALQKDLKNGSLKSDDVCRHLKVVSDKVRSAEAFRSVTGMIPVDVLDAVEHALRILTPMTAFIGDFELTNLLSSLKIWLQKKRLEQEQQQQHNQSFTNLDFGEFGNASPSFNQYW